MNLQTGNYHQHRALGVYALDSVLYHPHRMLKYVSQSPVLKLAQGAQKISSVGLQCLELLYLFIFILIFMGHALRR